MENRFAGAQNQSQRRRRRLSSDDEHGSSEERQAVLELAIVESTVGPLQESILRRVVSPRLWKSILAIWTVLLSSIALIWNAPDELGFAVSDFREHLSDRAAGLLLIFAGQYAVLTGWIRSSSAVDFKGRYRCWKWMGLASCVSGVVLVLGVGGLLPGLLSSLLEPMTGQIQAAQPAIELAFCATISVVVLARVLPDMTRCIWSQAFLIGAILLTVVNVMLHHGAHSNVSEATFKSLTLLAANAMFASMLLHCRFVAFINNDPPEIVTPDDPEPMLPIEEPVVQPTPTVVSPEPVSSEKSTKPPKRKKRTSRRKAA